MEKIFDVIYHTRKNFLTLVDSLSVDRLNTIPANFNNNIIWNLAHIISSQQALTYGKAGLKYTISEEFVKAYGKNTKPENQINTPEIEKIKIISLQSLYQLREDYYHNTFKQYTAYKTSFNVEITSIEEAIKFMVAHEALHLGYAMALKRLV